MKKYVPLFEEFVKRNQSQEFYSDDICKVLNTSNYIDKGSWRDDPIHMDSYEFLICDIDGFSEMMLSVEYYQEGGKFAFKWNLDDDDESMDFYNKVYGDTKMFEAIINFMNADGRLSVDDLQSDLHGKLDFDRY